MLDRALERVHVGAGGSIFPDQEPRDAIYLVLEGLLHAVEADPNGAEMLVRTIGPGELVDELQVYSGALRGVAVRAAVDTELLKLPGIAADTLAEHLPDLRGARERLHRRQLLCRLHRLFGTFDARLLNDLEASVEWTFCSRGDLLYEANARSNGLYFVVSGRLEIIKRRRDGTTQVVSEVSRGDSVGEIAFFGGQERDECVQAVRDSVLVGLTTGEFEQFTSRQPRMVRRVAANVIERLSEGSASSARGAGGITNVAVIPAGPGAPLAEFCARLARALSTHGPTLPLTSAAVDELMAERGISQAARHSAESKRLLAWLGARESDNRFVLFQADGDSTPWTRRCLRQADLVLLLARAEDDPRVGDLERSLFSAGDRPSDAKQMLVLVHPDGSRLPSRTDRWLSGRNVAEQHHIRWDSDADVARLSRILAGRAVGLVLGGGGARGFAHIGVLRALDEAGVPIDMIGGTSMGAQIAAQYAMGMSPEEIRDLNYHVWVNIRPQAGFTLPLFSVINDRKARACAEMMYGEYAIEDLWLPYYCISSNLSTAEMVVHRRGLLRNAASASAALPGWAPPVVDGNHLLVDGAVLNNVPVDVMLELGPGIVLASEVSIEEDEAFLSESVPAPWEAMCARMFKRKEQVRFPSVLELAMRAATLHSTFRQRVAIEQADLCFRPPIDGCGLLECGKIHDLEMLGYEYAKNILDTPEASNILRPVATQL